MLGLLSACAPRLVSLPTDPGAPLPDFASLHADVTAACREVRSLTAELGLSGSAADRSLRGRVIAGFAAPDSMRLEGVAPFGPPAFILVASGGEATLLLMRDDRVLRGAPPGEILGAMTGVALGPQDLQAILTGCVTVASRPTGGRLHENGWASIDLADGAVMFLEPDESGWRLRAARVRGWRVEYGDWQGDFPGTVRLVSDDEGREVNLSADVSQLDINVDLDAAAFRVDVPDTAQPLTLADLRAAGPLR